MNKKIQKSDTVDAQKNISFQRGFIVFKLLLNDLAFILVEVLKFPHE